MAANVVKGAQHAIVAPDRQQRLSDQVESKVVARVGDLMGVSNQLPGAGENPVFLFLESLLCEVAASSESGGARDVAIWIHLEVDHDGS